VLPTPPLTPWGVSSWPHTTAPSGSLLKPEYIAAGAAVAVVAWLLLRKRK
jgi:hypothetical protein